MFDIIGDVHGCWYELCDLLKKLGYGLGKKYGTYEHKNGRKAIFVGDLCDRGLYSAAVLDTVMRMVEHNAALCVTGNHDNKLMRYLKGNKVTINNGLDKTIEQLKYRTEDFRIKLLMFLQNLPWRLQLDNGRLIVVHAAAPEYLQHDMEKMSSKRRKAAKAAALYGITTGKTNEKGYPERLDWAKSYSGSSIVVHGHVASDLPVVKNNVYNIDTGCVYGNKLTALRYPEMEFVCVNAYHEYVKK